MAMDSELNVYGTLCLRVPDYRGTIQVYCDPGLWSEGNFISSMVCINEGINLDIMPPGNGAFVGICSFALWWKSPQSNSMKDERSQAT
jgi:hypothetical protein